MIRTVALSLLISSAPLFLISELSPPTVQYGAMGLAFILPLVSVLLVRHTRRRTEQLTRRHTLDMLARGNPTLDLILAEAERRAALQGSRKAR